MAKWQGGVLQLSPSLMAEGSTEMTGVADCPERPLAVRETGIAVVRMFNINGRLRPDAVNHLCLE